MGPDAPVAERNILGVIHKVGLEIGSKVIQARHYGHTTVEMIGGRKVHPCTSIPGGLTKGITEEQRKEIEEMGRWSRGSFLEQRAAAAALCEPALLHRPDQVERVLQILDEITTALTTVQNRRDDDFKVLRQGLGYCWSVAVVALPAVGQPLMEKWLASLDKDVRWIMKENLQKKRLARLDPDWVEQSKALLA
jgi:hypothetical protein